MYNDNPKLNPEAKLINKVDKLTPELEAMCKDTSSIFGTGGMKTKIHAAEIANRSGIPMVLTNGSRPADLYQILEGKSDGNTLLYRKLAGIGGKTMGIAEQTAQKAKQAAPVPCKSFI